MADVAAVAIGSTSSQTITGEWPPSSMITGFMCAPAIADKCLPTGTDPVNVTSRTEGCGIRYSETSDGLPNTRFSTPRRQTGVVERLHQLHCAGRCFLGSFQDDRATGRQSTADLARRGTHRTVARRDGRAHVARMA